MDAVTYPDKAVADFISKRVIPVRVTHDRILARNFRVKWTPTLILLDFEGDEVCREEGFLHPEGLIPALMLGLGKVRLHAGQYVEAISSFQQVTSEYPKSAQAPEAIYFRGVARYQSANDMKALREAYEELKAAYPESTWTEKAFPYSDIK
ncbi:MAG: tetratricopeptide repeat protein [Desulfomonile tiedjei]|nr:tetratricopeptide repeat protein [Desulfomonile tiedjei]